MRSFRKIAPVFAAALLLLGVAASPAYAASAKKGVNVNNYPGVSTALRDVGAAWYHTWAVDTQGVTTPPGVEFVPMVWGRNSVTTSQLNTAKSLGTTLLGFNEPDMAGQANMSPGDALGLWPQLQATGMRLGSPSVAYGGDVAGGWLDQFMSGASARGYRVDFIQLHWFGGDFSDAATGELKSYIDAVYNRYHKPIWLTEYALIDFSHSTPVYPSQDQQVRFVRQSTAMLNGLSSVERYAWFSLSTSTAPTGLYANTTPNATGVAYRAV